MLRWVFPLILILMAMQTPARADTVLLEADPWCPHTCGEGAAPNGYMVDLAREALATQGYRVVYRNAAWARVMQDVRDGVADGAVGALAGESAGLALHTIPLGRQSNAFVVRSDDPWVFSDLDSLKGRMVGTIQDYSYSDQIDAWLASKQTEIQPLGGENALDRNLLKLQSHRLDVVVDDEAVLRARLRTLPNADQVRIAGRMPGGDLFIAFTPKNGRGAKLAEALDKGMAELKAKGRIKPILDRYGIDPVPR